MGALSLAQKLDPAKHPVRADPAELRTGCRTRSPWLNVDVDVYVDVDANARPRPRSRPRPRTTHRFPIASPARAESRPRAAAAPEMACRPRKRRAASQLELISHPY